MRQVWQSMEESQAPWYCPVMPSSGEVQAALAEVADLQRNLTAALEAGDPGAVERVLAELSEAEKRRNRLLQRAVTGEGGAFDAAPPIREQVASVLAIMRRPASAGLAHRPHRGRRHQQPGRAALSAGPRRRRTGAAADRRRRHRRTCRGGPTRPR